MDEMNVIVSLLVLGSCFVLTTEEPQLTAYTYLHSDIDACTRYNFLPINTKNFREAVLFFNLCEQLIHLLPEDHRKDYARRLRKELIMTKKQFASKYNDKDIAEWLDGKIDSLVQELNRLQSNIGGKNGLRQELSWQLLPSDIMNYFRKKDNPLSTSRYLHSDKAGTTVKSTKNNNEPLAGDRGFKHLDSDEADKDDDLFMTEEKIDVNDVALIGVILGMVSTLSAVLTLLYICYCGAKRAKKKVKSDDHQHGGANDDKEKLANQGHSKVSMRSQCSTKIESKINDCMGRTSQYRSFAGGSPTKNNEQNYENTEETILNVDGCQDDKDILTVDHNYDQVEESFQWEQNLVPESDTNYFENSAVNLENISKRDLMGGIASTKISTQGFPSNQFNFTNSTDKEQNRSEYYCIPENELQRGCRESGLPSINDDSNKLVEQSLVGNEKTLKVLTDVSGPQNYNQERENRRHISSLSYTTQNYSDPVSLISSPFSYDFQQQKSLQKTLQARQLQQEPETRYLEHETLPSTQLQQQIQKIDENQESNQMKTVEQEERQALLDLCTPINDENQGNNKCKKCKKRVFARKRQDVTMEDPSTLIRMKMEASKVNTDTNNNERSKLVCNSTDSENIMRQEKFLCSLSATTPLKTQEPCMNTGDKMSVSKQEMLEPVSSLPTPKTFTKNASHPAKGDPSDNILTSPLEIDLMTSSSFTPTEPDLQQISVQKQCYMALHTPAVKKYHRRKCVHPKSPLANSPVVGKKLAQNIAMQDISSSYFSVKPTSPYQSCAQVDRGSPALGKDVISSLGAAGVPTRGGEGTYTSKMQQKDFRKSLKQMFSNYTPTLKETNNGHGKLHKR